MKPKMLERYLGLVEEFKTYDDEGKDLLALSGEAVQNNIKIGGREKWHTFVLGDGNIGKEMVRVLRRAELLMRCADGDEKRWGEYLWDVYNKEKYERL